MRDLRVLEEQQRESHRKLQAAQETKQRRMQQHATLESKLGELKYQNGQSRAEVQQMRTILSDAQRKIGAMRLKADGAGDDLGGFDR
jgi:predicted  nucleic acid-binding Zn-ribbon protein